MTIGKILGIIAISILGTVLAIFLCVAVSFIINSWLEWMNKATHYWLDIKEKNQRIKLDSVRRLMPDENTRQGIVFDGETFRSLDNGYVHTMMQDIYFNPVMYRLDRIQQTLLALKGSHLPQDQLPEIIMPSQEILLPNSVSLEEAIQGQRISLDNLVIGVTIEDGEIVPVTRSLHDLLHLLAIGITGAGKSTWVLSFLAEIEMCRQPVDVCLIDVHGSAFNVLSDWGKLKYPVARTNDEARAIFEAVKVESERRMELYEQVPLADDLPSYNQYAGGEPLVPWLIVVDEGTLMLADRSISQFLAAAVQGTRQYGIYVFLSGQTANASVIKTPIRDNCPTRICFNNEINSIRVTLGGNPPGDLEEIPGRGWARLKGKNTPIKIQAPIIRRGDLYNRICRTGPREPFPILEGECETVDEEIPEAERIRALSRAGYSKRQIEETVYGHPGGDAYYKVSRVLG